MFALNQTVGPRIARAIVQQTRNSTYIATKPRVRVSFAEKCAHGAFIFVVALTIPVWCAKSFNKWRPASEN